MADPTPRPRARPGDDGLLVRLSDHARERAAEMDVRTKEVKRAVLDPELSYDQADLRYRDFVMAIRGRLACPYKEEVDPQTGRVVRTVITVMWRAHDQWWARERGPRHYQSA